MSETGTTTRTLEDDARGRTDWNRLRAMSEEEVEANAAADPDNPPWTEEELRAAELVAPVGAPKTLVSIRLDREVLEFFRAPGPGYQSRINAVLLGYVRSRRQHDDV